jgi:ferredoxin, 2Fe-2S
MRTVRIEVVDDAGERHTVAAPVGVSVRQALQEAGLIEGECGGSLACATCHVWLDPAFAATFAPPEPEEEDMLDVAFNIAPTSRLSCQLVVGPDSERLSVSLPR